MLRVLGSAWGTVARARAALFANGWRKRQRLDRPVISVGALSVGGAGKTPAAALVAALLREAGFRPAILSRGYKRSSSAPLLVSAGDGDGPCVAADRAGDEPFWLATALPEVAVAVAARRERAAALLPPTGAFDVLVLDDGYQHLRVARDADLLIVNPEAPFWEDAPLPAGRLREAPEAADRADAFLVIGENDATHAVLEERFAGRPRFALRRQAPRCWPLESPTPRVAATEPEQPGVDSLPTAPLFAFAGIARPQRFFDQIATAGCDLRGQVSFPDHHEFRAADLAEVVAAARTAGAEVLVTTEKDAVRLQGASAELPVLVWSYRLAARQPAELLAWLDRQASLSARRSAA